MLVTLIVISALLAGAAVLVSMQLTSSKSTDLTKTGLSSLYCAEAGLSAARTTIAANYSSWAGSLCVSPNLPYNCTQPAWLSNTAFSHDLDGDNVDDFMVYIKDNDDEGTGTNAPGLDNDLQIFVVSKCIKYVDSPKEVEELIKYTPTADAYPWQEGGRNGRGNQNH